MALKDTWVDLEEAIEGVPDSGDEASAEPINRIAHAVISLENNGGGGGTGEPGKSPYIGENGNWFEYNGTQYVDTGVKAQGKDGESGLPKIILQKPDNTSQMPNFEPYSEVRFTEPVVGIEIYEFPKNTASPNNDMWSLMFTAKEGFSLWLAIDLGIEWAVAEPVFTAGYTYYLSFIPFGDKILGVWVAKELSAE